MTSFDVPSLSALREALCERSRVDLRALAALRIGLGSLLLTDLALRARSMTAFYTDDGIVTREVLAAAYPTYQGLSIHALSGDLWFQVILFLAAGIAAVSLTLGYRTRLVTVVSLVLLVSVHARNPTLLNSGDVLLRRLLFFAIFLPMGARWAVDVRERDQSRASVATLASLALLVQIVLVYLVNAGYKLGSEVWRSGDAVGYVLSLNRFDVFLAPVLSQIAPLSMALSWAWLGLLLSSWLLLVTTGRYRGVLASLFIAMHAGMALTMDLGIFPFVSIAGLLPLLPSSVWDRIEADISSRIDVPDNRTRATENQAKPVSQLRDGVARFRPIVHASLLVLVLVTAAMGAGLVPTPEGAPDKLSESSWKMFAPPPTHDTWVVAEGTFASGHTTDLVRGEPARLDRPPDTDRYPNARWRKHLSRYERASPLPAAFASYHCRQQDDGRDDGLTEVRLVRAWTPVEGDGLAETETRELGRFRCTDGGIEAISSG